MEFLTTGLYFGISHTINFVSKKYALISLVFEKKIQALGTSQKIFYGFVLCFFGFL